MARRTGEASAARRAQGEESRAKLVEAAAELIAEHGFGATSVGDICRRAGVAKTALYWHFENKEGLLAAVLERVGGGWIEEMRKSAYLEADPLARLNRVIDDWRTVMESQPQLVRLPLFLQLELRPDSSDEIRIALRRVIEQAEQALAEGIEDSIGRGRVQDLDLLAQTTLSLMSAAVQRAAIAIDAAEVDRIFDELRRTLVVVICSRLPEDVQHEILENLGGLDA